MRIEDGIRLLMSQEEAQDIIKNCTKEHPRFEFVNWERPDWVASDIESYHAYIVKDKQTNKLYYFPFYGMGDDTSNPRFSSKGAEAIECITRECIEVVAYKEYVTPNEHARACLIPDEKFDVYFGDLLTPDLYERLKTESDKQKVDSRKKEAVDDEVFAPV